LGASETGGLSAKSQSDEDKKTEMCLLGAARLARNHGRVCLDESTSSVAGDTMLGEKGIAIPIKGEKSAASSSPMSEQIGKPGADFAVNEMKKNRRADKRRGGGRSKEGVVGDSKGRRKEVGGREK